MKIIGIIIIAGCILGNIFVGYEIHKSNDVLINFFKDDSKSSKETKYDNNLKSNIPVVKNTNKPYINGKVKKLSSNGTDLGVSISVPSSWSMTTDPFPEGMIEGFVQLNSGDDFNPVYMVYVEKGTADPEYFNIEKFQEDMKKDVIKTTPELTYIDSTVWKGEDGKNRYSLLYFQKNEQGKELKGKMVFVYNKQHRIMFYLIDDKGSFNSSEKVFDDFVSNISINS